LDFNLINNYDGFQALAAYHDTFFDRPSPLENQEFILLHKYIDQLEISGNKLLDIGCGTGDFCFYMANCGYSIVGIDYSDNMLLVARNKLALFKNSINARNTFLGSVDRPETLAKNSLTSVTPKIKFLKNDICVSNCVSEQFNLISMINALSYIKPENRDCVFSNISNCLYSKGYVIFNIVTRAEFEHALSVKYENSMFDYEINYDYKKDHKLSTTCYKFYESGIIKTPFEIHLAEYEHSLGDIVKVLQKCELNVLKIIPNTPIYSDDEVDLNKIIEAVEASYAMPNGARSVIFVAQKK